MEFTRQRITPQIARRMLDTDDENRGVRMVAVRRFADDMKRGRWADNGESIKFDERGRLIDGQHRLRSVILADVDVWMTVATNVPRGARWSIDTGLSRTAGDELGMQGEQNANVLSAALTRLDAYETGSEASFGARLSTARVLELLDKHPGMRDSVPVARRVTNSTGYDRPSLAVCLHYVFGDIDAADNEAFWDGVLDGLGLSRREDPRWALRRTVEASHAGLRSSGLPERLLWAYTVQAWNAFRGGEDRKLFRWRPPSPFPRPE